MRNLTQPEVEALPDGSGITVYIPGIGECELVLRHDEKYPWPIAVNKDETLACELIWCGTPRMQVLLTTDARKLEKARQEARR